MLGSTLLDVLIGLVLIYFVLSLTCSAAVELLAGFLRSRAINFKAAICNLLAEPMSLEAAAQEAHSTSTTATPPSATPQASNPTGVEVLPSSKTPQTPHEAAPPSSPAILAPLTKDQATADQQASKLSIDLFKNHPLVASISGQKVGKHFNEDAGWPSYMHARTFSSVVLDCIAPKGLPANQQRTFWALRASVVAPQSLPKPVDSQITSDSLTRWTPNLHVNSILRSFVAVAEAHVADDDPNVDVNRLALFRSQIESWFEEGMDRAAGWYKQKSQLRLIIIAAVLTLLLNVDTIRIVRQLYSNPTARSGLVALAQQAANTDSASHPKLRQDLVSRWQDIDEDGVSLGWRHLPKWDASLPTTAITKLGGLLLTIMAVSLGAPFWFDMLNKLVNVRAAGARPEKSDAGKMLDQLTGAETDAADTPDDSAVVATAAAATAIAAAAPSAALILPANYWAQPVRKTDLLKFDPNRAGYSSQTAALMARLSMLAYVDEPQLRRMVDDAWGIKDLPREQKKIKVFRQYDQVAFGIDLGSAVAVAFRGTVPAKLNTILADAGICLVDCPFASGQVHCGFLSALEDIDEQITPFIEQYKDKPLFLTGHSLGAAMATLYAAQRIAASPPVAGLYTFGSPRVGDLAFVSALNQSLSGKTFRFINEEDLVTRVAPRQLKYDHMDVPLLLDAAGRLETTGVAWSRFLNTVVNALDDFRKEAQSSIYDHHIELYVRKLDNLA